MMIMAGVPIPNQRRKHLLCPFCFHLISKLLTEFWHSAVLSTEQLPPPPCLRVVAVFHLTPVTATLDGFLFSKLEKM